MAPSHRLSNTEVLTITRAAVLLPRWSGVLSPFEVEIVELIGRRFIEHGRATHVTFNE